MASRGSGDRIPIGRRQGRWIAALAVLALVALGLRLMLGPAGGDVVRVDPTSTYLRTDPADGAGRARAVPLSALGLEAGERARLVRVGRWRSVTGGPRTELVALFSADDSLRMSTRRRRVPGALDAGTDHRTRPTHHGHAPTDVPGDFGFGGPGRDTVTVTVPERARYLFFSVDDTLFSDNSVAEAPFGVRVGG